MHKKSCFLLNLLSYNGFSQKAITNRRSETTMEDHSKQRLLFKDLGGKKVEADFEGGEVTSDAGVLFFREVDRRIRLTGRGAGGVCRRRPPEVRPPLDGRTPAPTGVPDRLRV